MSTKAQWQVEGEEGDVWFEGTESECREYRDQHGYRYTAYVNPSQQRLVVFGMKPNA